MSRQRSGGRSGARTSAVGAPESSSTASASGGQGTRATSPSKRPEQGQTGPSDRPSDPPRGLLVIATPIGNLGDITLRALETLKLVDVIACEDTRVTRRLLDRYAVTTSMLAYHEHNAERVRPKLVERLKTGDAVGLVTDAGTPLISDPGFKLVRAAIDAGVPVTALPGPTAMIMALTVGGLPTDRFMFAGFLPNRQTARRRTLEELRALDATLVFYESPRRLAATLADMSDLLGSRDAAVGRELTKRYEEVIRGPIDELVRRYANVPAPRGEIVIVVGPPKDEPFDEASLENVLVQVLPHHSLRDAVDQVTADTGLPRRTVYRRALILGKQIDVKPKTGDK